MKKILYLAVCCSFFIAGGCGSASYLTEVSATEQEISKDSQSVVETEIDNDTAFAKADDLTENVQVFSEENSGDEAAIEDAGGTKYIFVQITGAVKYPGVYELKAGSRLFKAVEEAGGYTSEADITSVNGASTLLDGQNIYVYSLEEAALLKNQGIVADGTTFSSNLSLGNGAFSGTQAIADDGLININTADKNELMTLPGIGELRADTIITYRSECGGFKKIEDIMQVSGIKDSVFNKIKDKIKV